MAISIRLAVHESEGQDENFIAGLIADMQGPMTPIFKAGCCDERSHLAGRLLARLDQVGYRCTATILQRSSSVGAMEVDVSHVTPPLNIRVSKLDPAYRSYTRPQKRSSVIKLTGYLLTGRPARRAASPSA